MNILINSLCCTAGFVYTKPRETGVSGVVCYHRPLHLMLPKDRGGRSGREAVPVRDRRTNYTNCLWEIHTDKYLSLTQLCLYNVDDAPGILADRPRQYLYLKIT